jgi:preprotein translocase subunit SecE
MAEEESEQREAQSEGRTFGLERWVQFGFIALAALVFWLADKIVFLVWDQFAEPDATIVAGVAALVGIVTAFLTYKNADANAFASESVAELSKVTWPTRKETWSNTVVTVIVSMIAAAILFAFVATWSAITDLIYKV